MVIVQSTRPDLVLAILTILEKYWNEAYAFFINSSPDLEAWQIFSLLIFIKSKYISSENGSIYFYLNSTFLQSVKTKQNKRVGLFLFLQNIWKWKIQDVWSVGASTVSETLGHYNDRSTLGPCDIGQIMYPCSCLVYSSWKVIFTL